MPGVELKSSLCEGRVVVAPRGELGALLGVRRLALTGKDEAFRVQPSVAAAVAGIPGRRRRYAWRRRPVSIARPGRAASSPTCTG